MTTPAALTWTPLSRRLRMTTTKAQRRHILAARKRMEWTEHLDASLTQLPTSVRAIAAALHEQQLLRAVGRAELADGLQLIGLSDVHGTSDYLLDLDGAALHVLIETKAAATSHPRVA
jgi:hypothetical protein